MLLILRLNWTHCATSPRMGWNRHFIVLNWPGLLSQNGLIGTSGMSQTDFVINLQCFQGELKAEKKNPVYHNK